MDGLGLLVACDQSDRCRDEGSAMMAAKGRVPREVFHAKGMDCVWTGV